MQAAGMVNDHTLDCYRHAECAALAQRDQSRSTRLDPSSA
jgi:hypothetical protein